LRVRALVWVQGESDANAKDAPLYGANLTRMLEKLRADLAAPEMILLLGVNTRFGNGNNQFMPGVIESQKSVAAKLSRTRYVDTDGAETLPPSHTHFTAQGTLEIGRRYAEALLEVEGAQHKAK
jgi:lysophospholipase L1-like esterase